MSDLAPRILVVDDEEVMQDILTRLLGGNGYRVTVAGSAEDGLRRLTEEDFELVVLDLMLPGIGGLEALGRIKQLDPDLPVIMITAHATVENAIEAMKGGAFDYQVKPFRNDELLLVVNRAIADFKLRAENRKLRRELRERYSFDNIIGRSEEMRRVFDLIEQAAPSRSTILVEGESGTGKELVARAVHQLSPRADGPFVVVNCGSLPTELQESTLFGHVVGAFAGATTARKGLFEMAAGGSIFFDEVSSIGRDVQAKLLRVLQEREIMRLGSSETTRVDVRIIAATHADLHAAVDAGAFREDLYYRLKVISIPIPPLRDRVGDVPLIAAHMLHKYARENDKKVRSIHPQALRLLAGYHWPGNVRELENVIQKAVVLCRGEEIAAEMIEDDVRPGRGGSRSRARVTGGAYKDLVAEFEREIIVEALRQSDGVQKRAAELLQLKPTTLNEKIKRLHIRYRS